MSCEHDVLTVLKLEMFDELTICSFEVNQIWNLLSKKYCFMEFINYVLNTAYIFFGDLFMLVFHTYYLI